MFNIIDRLVNAQERYKVKRQKVDDKTNAKNSAIGCKITKMEDKIQRLQDKALVNRKAADNKMALIDRKLKKIKGQLQLEVKYNNSIVEEK